MSDTLIRVLILATVSDGEIQKEELDIINTLRKSHASLSRVSDQEVQVAIVDIYNKLSAGMEAEHIIGQLGNELDVGERNSAYAIAKEVCAADFKILPAETEFMDLLERVWGIPEDIQIAVNSSLKLRYSI